MVVDPVEGMSNTDSYRCHPSMIFPVGARNTLDPPLNVTTMRLLVNEVQVHVCSSFTQAERTIFFPMNGEKVGNKIELDALISVNAPIKQVRLIVLKDKDGRTVSC